MPYQLEEIQLGARGVLAEQEEQLGESELPKAEEVVGEVQVQQQQEEQQEQQEVQGEVQQIAVS